MAESAQLFIEESRSLLRSYLVKIEHSVAQLSTEDVWWRPNEASNSIGNLLLHLRGNVTQWIVGGVGRQPYERHRQQEFDERSPRSIGELMAGLKAVLDEADGIIAGLQADSLATRRHVQNYDTTVLQAIYHVVEHFSMHTGQIILITKARTGSDLGLWKPPQ
jgi:uncharacterized damage-inducible protein DinB